MNGIQVILLLLLTFGCCITVAKGTSSAEFVCKSNDVECLSSAQWDKEDATLSTDFKEFLVDNAKNQSVFQDNGGAPRHAKYVPHSPLIPCKNL
jgi:hypothetical protein